MRTYDVLADDLGGLITSILPEYERETRRGVRFLIRFTITRVPRLRQIVFLFYTAGWFNRVIPKTDNPDAYNFFFFFYISMRFRILWAARRAFTYFSLTSTLYPHVNVRYY